jgi:sensor domain CHASE-containing protein
MTNILFAVGVTSIFLLVIAYNALRDEQEEHRRIQRETAQELETLYFHLRTQIEINNDLLMRVAQLENDPLHVIKNMPENAAFLENYSWN